MIFRDIASRFIKSNVYFTDIFTKSLKEVMIDYIYSNFDIL